MIEKQPWMVITQLMCIIKKKRGTHSLSYYNIVAFVVRSFGGDLFNFVLHARRHIRWTEFPTTKHHYSSISIELSAFQTKYTNRKLEGRRRIRSLEKIAWCMRQWTLVCFNTTGIYVVFNTQNVDVGNKNRYRIVPKYTHTHKNASKESKLLRIVWNLSIWANKGRSDFQSSLNGGLKKSSIFAVWI